jgi:hypothetical protein
LDLDVETALILIGIPAAIVLLVGGVAYAFGGGAGRTRRYRPGRPYEFAPVWFLSAPEQLTSGAAAGALGARPQPPALSTGEVEAGRGVPQGSTGGASDRW